MVYVMVSIQLGWILKFEQNRESSNKLVSAVFPGFGLHEFYMDSVADLVCYYPVALKQDR